MAELGQTESPKRQTSLSSNMGLSRDVALLPGTAGNGPHVTRHTQHGTSFTRQDFSPSEVKL